LDRVFVEGSSLVSAAEAAGVSEWTAWKWVDRYRREGDVGLEDRSVDTEAGAVANTG
jgi:transposase